MVLNTWWLLGHYSMAVRVLLVVARLGVIDGC